MLAELAGLDRKSAGRVLVATIAANVDDIGSTTTTPWRVMSWEPRAEAAPQLVDGEVTELRADLENALVTLDKLRACIEHVLPNCTDHAAVRQTLFHPRRDCVPGGFFMPGLCRQGSETDETCNSAKGRLKAL